LAPWSPGLLSTIRKLFFLPFPFDCQPHCSLSALCPGL
jgi:hypothetical protein